MISTLILDIETTDLNADRGVTLCACYESSEQPGRIHVLRNDRIEEAKWRKGQRGDDKKLVKELRRLIHSHDVVVAHNGHKFDLPFIRTRSLRWRLKPVREPKLVDPLKISWNKFRLRKNSLGPLAGLMGVADKKTPLDMAIWMDAMLNGSPKAMNLIVKHCIADVRVLSKVLQHVKPFIKIFDDRGSAL